MVYSYELFLVSKYIHHKQRLGTFLVLQMRVGFMNYLLINNLFIIEK